MNEKMPDNRRRSTRLSIAIPIFVSGTNVQGGYFREKTHTFVVNKHGAKIATSQELAVGAEIVIENPAAGVVAKAMVVALSDQQKSESLPTVAVELRDARNIWGIQFPPEDWE